VDHRRRVGERAALTELDAPLVVLDCLHHQGSHRGPVDVDVELPLVDGGDDPATDVFVGVGHAPTSAARRDTAFRNGPRRTWVPAQAASVTRLSSGRNTTGDPGRAAA